MSENLETLERKVNSETPAADDPKEIERIIQVIRPKPARLNLPPKNEV